MTDKIQLEEDSAYDTTSPDIEGVRKFMEESSREAVDKEPEPASETHEPQEWDGQPINMTWGDPSFDAEAQATDADEEAYNSLATAFAGYEKRITDSDKETFLLATLNGDPYKSDIELLGGKMTVRCVDLSDYAKQVALMAAMNTLRDSGATTVEYARALERRYRAVLQIEAVNGRPLKHHMDVTFTGGNLYESLTRDAAKVTEMASVLQAETPAMLMTMYVKALAAFELKTGVLLKAAFDGTFWDPAAQGS